MALQSLDVVRRSATTTAPPGVRAAYTGTVAKLIDTTKCIGCKACQVACMEWNDLRRSEEHTSELQSQSNLVCRLLLEKKKKGVHQFMSARSCDQYPQAVAPDDAAAIARI